MFWETSSSGMLVMAVMDESPRWSSEARRARSDLGVYVTIGDS